MTGSTIGHYRIADRLGAGGMGEVWRARDTRLNRDVAIKILPSALAADPERMARFEREAQVLASLNHPNIAVLYGLETTGDSPALVMELVEGETLAERISSGAIPLAESLQYARQIAEALESAHERGVIHRDLKPANVMITPQGAVKLLDFGLAKALDDAPVNAKSQANSPTLSVAATRAGVLLGTAGYMSPEQVKGKAADKRVDIWAFGVVLYEMLTGRQLYRGETIADSLAAVITTTPDTGVLPSQVRRLVERCLEKDAHLRLRDIGEARILLARGGDQGDDLQVGAGPPGAASARGRALVAAAAIPLLALAALSFVHFRERPPESPALQFTVPLPKGPAASFAVSPDGRRIVISITGPKNPLLLRSFDSAEATPLAGTEDAMFPFWSPDSRFIGFFAQAKLKKVAIIGGPPLTLCDAANGRGGAWNDDGMIVFSPNLSEIRKVHANGGVPAKLIDAKGTTLRFPVFLPDGRRYLYLVSAGTTSVNGVYVAPADGGAPPRRILADVSSVAWLPPRDTPYGHLLFIRDATLMAQPTDPESLDPAGEVFPVAERVQFTTLLNYAPISISPGGVLAFLRGGTVGGRNAAWMDRQGRVLKSFQGPGFIYTLALSPDGQKIAAGVGTTDVEKVDLWVLEPDRGVQSQITFLARRTAWPAWSPDGKRIAFGSPDLGEQETRRQTLYVKDASGVGQAERLVEPTGFQYSSHWSSSGFLVYHELGGTSFDLKVLRMDGKSKPVTFFESKANEQWGRFSPDGRWMAYQSDESGRVEIYVRAVGPDGVAGEGKWRVSDAGGQQPVWTKQGREILYLSTDRNLTAVAVRDSGAAFAASPPQALFDLPVQPGNQGQKRFDATPDGERILAVIPKEGEVSDPISVILNWRPPAGK